MKLPESLDIEAATDLQKALIDALGDDQPLQLDASEVRHVDAAGLQLLLAAQRDFRKRQLDLNLLQPTAMLQQSIRAAGLETQFKPLWEN